MSSNSGGDEFKCGDCGKTFSRKANRNRHLFKCIESSRQDKITCDHCNVEFDGDVELLMHECREREQPIHNENPAPSGGDGLISGRDDEEGPHHLIQRGGGEFVVGDRGNPFEAPPADIEDGSVEDVVLRYWNSMKSRVRRQNVVDLLNVRLWDPVDQNFEADVGDKLIGCYNDAPHQIKINASLGCVLEHKTTGKFRYFHSSSNNATIFDAPTLIRSQTDLESFIDRVESTDLEATCIRRRPDTQWRLFAIANITFYMYKLLGVSRVGCSSINIPQHIRKTQNILQLTTNPSTGRRFDDSLCFFRCLAITRICRCKANRCRCTGASERVTKALFLDYLKASGLDADKFTGITEKDLLRVEKLFSTSISVYVLDSDNCATLIWNSATRAPQHMNVVLTDNHFCYIRNVDKLCNSFSCPGCGGCFTRAYNLKKHKCNSTEVSQMRFEGGTFKKSLTIFDQIHEEIGLSIPEGMRYYPFRITYDIETFLPKTDLPENTSTTSYESRHELLSISVCSNVPKYTKPVCFVRKTTEDECVSRFAEYILQISDEAKELMEEKFSTVFTMLEKLIDHREEAELSWVDKKMSNPRTHSSRQRCAGLEKKLEQYLHTIPVVGFNSQKYDINVMKASLVRNISRLDGDFSFIVKKCESMCCMQTQSLRFVDICNYIAPGYTYAKYLEAYGVSQRKGFFPYEWMDDLSKLSHTSLPSKECFFSSLTQKTISDEDYDICSRAWKENDMHSIQDFLIWYNNLDVAPFLIAIENQSLIYKHRGIDMLKAAISLPGLAVEWLFTVVEPVKSLRYYYDQIPIDRSDVFRLIQAIQETRQVHLIDRKDSDLYKLFKDNIVGGPSLVFHRYHEKGVTKIREREFGESAKDCKSILGLDANALYLLCVMGDMPVGLPIRRSSEDEFRPQRKVQGISAQGWLAYMEFCENTVLETNISDCERRLGRHNLPVDGYDPVKRIVYQYHGCFWHGHGCSEAAKKTHGGKVWEARLKETRDKTAYLRDLGYCVVEKWECAWTKEVNQSPHLKVFLKTFFDQVFRPKEDKLTNEDILSRVRNGSLFGFVECDISVPEQKRKYFEDNPPLFKNVCVSRADLSPHMRSFAEENGHLKTPQRSLIGSMHAVKMLIFTELLAWYLQHGLVVTKIYQVVEYAKRATFQKFGESVSDARREGDVDPDKTLLANTAKLIGNSVYGKTITDKTRHMNVSYTEDVEIASKKIRNSRFHSMTELECDGADPVYETSSFKKILNLNIPISLGVTILQKAKLRMLEFNYDCLDRFIPRECYQQMSTDTDSNYCAFSDELEYCVRPHLLNEFLEEYDRWFVTPFCPAHKDDYASAVKDRTKWIPHKCCEQVKKYSNRTPGLFKEEFKGSGMVALNAKTYICWRDCEDLNAIFGEEAPNLTPSQLNNIRQQKESNSCKYSSKGLSKRTNKLTKDQYMKVLKTGVAVKGVNRGFIKKNHKTFTYSQLKTALTYFYGKRKVLDNGIDTLPIDL